MNLYAVENTTYVKVPFWKRAKERAAGPCDGQTTLVRVVWASSHVDALNRGYPSRPARDTFRIVKLEAIGKKHNFKTERVETVTTVDKLVEVK